MIQPLRADNAALAQTSLMYVEDPMRVAKPVDYTVPDSLNALPMVEAELTAAGKINNFHRAGVSRMPPMEGVLRYERDTVINVKAEAAAVEAARIEEERLAREAAAAEDDRVEEAAAEGSDTSN